MLVLFLVQQNISLQNKSMSNQKKQRPISLCDKAHLNKIVGINFMMNTGQGSYGTTYSANKKKTFLCKIYKTLKNQQSLLIKEEIQINKILKYNPHRNIVEIEQVNYIQKSQQNPWMTAYIKTELLDNNSLASAITGHQTIEDKLESIYGIISSIVHLHSIGIEHNNIILKNFTKNENRVVKLRDFSCAYTRFNKLKHFHLKNQNILKKNQNGKGIQLNFPPEFVENIEFKTIGATDVWMVANLIVQMIWKQQAVEYKYNLSNVIINDLHFFQQKKQRYTLKIKQTSKLNFKQETELIQLLNKCYTYHPDNRISSKDLYDCYKKDIYPGESKNIELQNYNSKIYVANNSNIKQSEILIYDENKRFLIQKMIQAIENIQDDGKYEEITNAINQKFKFSGGSLMGKLREVYVASKNYN